VERAYEDLAGQADREDLEAWVKKFDRILFMPQRGAFFPGRSGWEVCSVWWIQAFLIWRRCGRPCCIEWQGDHGSDT